MIQINSKLDCCGCTACASSCPKSAITMVPDEEGFLYPKIDMRRCIECGACERACPILNKKTVISEKTEGYIIRIKDNKILYESTSGGAFTALAGYILEQNGIVYGAGYDNNMRVVCKRATTKQQLQEMRGSKFVQSDLGNIFQDIKKELKEGTTILFSGTPCQVAGLLSFLRKKPDNLLCVDFVCRGVPSPGLWDNYVKYMENKYSSKIVGARFKHKTYGYHTSTMKIDFANGKTYYGSGRVDPYMKAFVREISSRPSCAACAFKGIERPSDVTVFDCYEYSKITGKKDDNRGYSSIFVHTEKGGKILEAIKSYIEIQKEDVNAYEPIHAGKGWKSAIVTWYQKFKESVFFRKLFLLAFVTSLILFRTLLNRQLWMSPLSDVMGGWGIWETVNGEQQLTTECIENVIMMMPFSAVVMWTFGEKIGNSWKKILWQSGKIAFIFSISIEMLQLLLRLGTFQLSDIFYNTVGGMIGGLMYCAVMKVRKRL